MRIILPIYKKDIAEILAEHNLPIKTETIQAIQTQLESIAIAWASAWLQDVTPEQLQDAIDTFGKDG